MHKSKEEEEESCSIELPPPSAQSRIKPVIHATESSNNGSRKEEEEEEEEEEYIGISKVDQTRRLLIKGSNVNEFVKILARQTRAKITLKTSPQDEGRGVVHFGSPVRTSLISRVLQRSSLELILLVSRSTSSKASSSFLSSASSFGYKELARYPPRQEKDEEEEEGDAMNMGERKEVVSNNNNKQQQQQQYEEALFIELSSQLIRNPTWGMSDLYEYVVAQNDDKKQVTAAFMLVDPRRESQLQQLMKLKGLYANKAAINTSLSQQQPSLVVGTEPQQCVEIEEEEIVEVEEKQHDESSSSCMVIEQQQQQPATNKVAQRQEKSIQSHFTRHGKNAREQSCSKSPNNRDNVIKNSQSPITTPNKTMTMLLQNTSSN